MKKNIIIFVMLLFASCGKWLDVSPEDQINDKELFSSADGFRNALNGIYKEMSGGELYGGALTWQFVSALSQSYNENVGDYSMTYARKYDYEYQGYVKSTLSSIWLTAYNVIANCNKLLTKLDEAPADMFPQKQYEKDLIKGETLALRAMMHFELFRLFAPAPITHPTGNTIPYVSTYPSTMNPPVSTNVFMEQVMTDLINGRNLVAENDTIRNVFQIGGKADARINGSYSPVNGDKFYNFRGTRMNYVAITTLLARVSLYRGDNTLALKYAKEVYDNFIVRKKWWVFTSEDALMDDYAPDCKTSEDIIMAFYDYNLQNKYDAFVKNHKSLELQGVDNLFLGDEDDFRKKYLIRKLSNGAYEHTMWKMIGDESYLEYWRPLIPVIKLPEIYYTIAECLYDSDPSNAINMLKKVRRARGAKESLPTINSKQELIDQIIRDARREYLTQGEMFFMYKRLNRPIWDSVLDKYVTLGDKFILPIPESEII